MRQLAVGLILFAISAFAPACAGAQSTVAAPAHPITQVFLIQNSGWMEPFYTDPHSEFRPLVSSLIAQANLQRVNIVIATFNQDGQVPGHHSPEVVWSGQFDRWSVEEALKTIALPRKPGGAYADADFHGALRDTIVNLLHGQEGVIWMITNNKDSPNNSQDVIRNTQQFYSMLRTSPYISRIAAFPLRADLAGPNFHERGFIIYAFAYGEHAGEALDVILGDGAPARSLFSSPPVRIKPLDHDPVELRLSAQPDAHGVHAAVSGGSLLLTHVPGDKPLTLKLQGELRNTYYPQNIDSAALSATWSSPDADLSDVRVAISPSSLTSVQARAASGPVLITVELPKTPRKGPLFGWLDNDRTLVGSLNIHLDGIHFSLAPEFVERIAAISGAGVIQQGQAESLMSAQLPAVFLDYRQVSSATTSIPVVVQIRRAPVALILLLAAAAVAVGAGGFAGLWLTRARPYPVTVGATNQTLTIRPFEQRVVSDGFGIRASVRGALFGPPLVRSLAEE